MYARREGHGLHARSGVMTVRWLVHDSGDHDALYWRRAGAAEVSNVVVHCCNFLMCFSDFSTFLWFLKLRKNQETT